MVRPRLPSITASTLTSLGRKARTASGFLSFCVCGILLIVASCSIPQESIFIAAQCWPFPCRDRTSAPVQPKLLC